MCYSTYRNMFLYSDLCNCQNNWCYNHICSYLYSYLYSYLNSHLYSYMSNHTCIP